MTEELWDEHHLKILSTVVPVTQQRTCVDPRGTFSLGYTAVGSPFIVHQVLRLCCRTETGENKKLGKSLKAMEPTWIWKMDPSRKTSGKNKKQKKNREDKAENNRLDKIRMKKKIQLEKNIIKWITLRPELKHWKLESLQKTVTLTPRGVSDAGPWGGFAGRGRTRRQRMRLLAVVFKASQLSALTLHPCKAGLCAEPRWGTGLTAFILPWWTLETMCYSEKNTDLQIRRPGPRLTSAIDQLNDPWRGITLWEHTTLSCEMTILAYVNFMATFCLELQ